MSHLRFLHFPREIRDMIYFHAFQPVLTARDQHPDACRTFDLETGLRTSSNDIERYGNCPVVCPGILRVSRQIHQEAIPILYSGGKFELGPYIESFIKSIGPSNTALLRNIQITYRVVGRKLGRGAAFRQGVSKAKKLRRLMAATLIGVRILEIRVCHAANFRMSWGRGLVDVDRGLAEINQTLVRLLPSLRRTAFIVYGSSKDLCHPLCRPMLARVNELGWTIHRKNYLGRTMALEFEAFDLEKTLAELEDKGDLD